MHLIDALRKAGCLLGTSSRAAAEGTRAHSYLDPRADLEELDPYTRRRVEWVRERIADVLGAEGSPECEVHFERRLVFPAANGGEPVTYGRADVVADLGTHAVVLDAKFGQGEPREAFTTIQLAAYSLMAMRELSVSRVVAVALHVETERVDRQEYDDRASLERQLLAVVARAEAEPQTFAPSREACEYCDAAPWCAALRRAATQAVETAEGILRSDAPAELAEQFAGALDILAPAAQANERLRKLALRVLEAGGELPAADGGRYVFEEQAGRRQVTDAFGLYESIEGVVSREDYKRLLAPPVSKVEALATEGIYRERGGKGARLPCTCTANELGAPDPECPDCKGKGSTRNTKKDAARTFAELAAPYLERGEPRKVLRRKRR